ncbi:hypothetical protein EXIGLDRAFT_731284 [Exidia glandulosa HHB12029]|uniref:BTB domain-containing protein n=1 Tax=Exidia glandulosa HHB12029 TaxID=1314781 RepID=A0A165L3L9_EXIGL|nr:hypothetical protein EXIGLDRAFT_731284 [Exidia glandulosa HHB12029]
MDLILVSSDHVLFYAHSKILTGVSKNSFAGLLPPAVRSGSFDMDLELPAVRVQQSARVLNVVMHALYGFNPAPYAPDLDTLSDAMDALCKTYAIHQSVVLAPSLPLFTILAAHAPLQPFAVYALAAKHDMEPLAIAASQFLLSYPLSTITDDDARRLGAVYLRRLFFLHLGRIDALKRLLGPLPEMHTPTADCDAKVQEKLRRAWTLAAAFLIYENRADTTPQSLQATLGPLLNPLWCSDCRQVLSARIQSLITQWSTVKTTI